MSSLRRRAICVQRAMSTARSSIGARASARTTAPASEGSASNLSHASTSRISARWKKAASPTSRCGTARSSSATATACPSRAVDGRHRDRTRRTPSRESNLSTSAATDWACARSFAHRQNSTAPPISPSGSTGVSPRTTRPANATDGGQRCPSASGIDPRPGVNPCRHPRGAGAAEPSYCVVGVAGHRQRLTRELARKPRRRQVELLSVVDHSVLESRRERGFPGDQPQRIPEQVPGVAGTGLGEHPLMGPVDLGELLLDRVPAGRPRRVLLGADQLRLEPVDPADEPPHERGAATEVVVTDRELVDPLHQHREPVARSERVGAARAAAPRATAAFRHQLLVTPRQGHLSRIRNRSAAAADGATTAIRAARSPRRRAIESAPPARASCPSRPAGDGADRLDGSRVPLWADQAGGPPRK